MGRAMRSIRVKEEPVEEAVFVKMEEAAPKVEDGSERAEVGLSGTMTKDLTSEVEKGLKELDSTSDHPRIPFDGDRNSKEVWLRTEGGEKIRLVHTSSRGFGLQLAPARRRPLSEKDDVTFVMVTKLRPMEDVDKFVQSWNSKAKKYKDNDVRKEKLDILRTRDGKNAACYVVSRSIAHLLNTPGKGEDGKLHTPTHELTNPEQPKEEVAFWIWRARAKLETKLKTKEELTMTYEYEWKEAPPPPPEKPPKESKPHPKILLMNNAMRAKAEKKAKRMRGLKGWYSRGSRLTS